VLSAEEKDALRLLADRERLPAAAVVRLLIWEAVQRDTETQGTLEPCYKKGGMEPCSN